MPDGDAGTEKPTRKAGGGRWASTQPKRDEFLRLIALGRSKGEACEELGIPRDTYLTWRSRYPEWKVQVDITLDRVQGVKAEDIRLGPQSSFIDKRLAYFGYDSAWHHRQMIEAIEQTPPGGVTLILMPPEHAKTSVASDLISIEIAENPNIRIGYVSESLQLSRKACGKQRRRLEPDGARQFPLFHADHGPFHDLGRSSLPWSADYFTVMRATHDQQDYTFEARAANSQIAGTRLDRLYIDDIQSLNNIDQTPKLVGKIRQDFLSRVSSKGKTIILGTRVEEGDVYQVLIKEGIVDRVVALPATNGEIVECPMGEDCDLKHIPHEQPLWPEWWPVHDLARKRKIVGEVAWARNFQQRPTDAADRTFTPTMVEEARDKMTGRADVLPKSRHFRRFATLDPALVGGMSLMGFHAAYNHLRIIGLVRKFNMTRSENIIAEIDAAWITWGGFTDLIVEENAYQKALANDERLRALARTRGFHIHPHQTNTNKRDPDFGVAQMASSLNDREVSWLYGDPTMVEEMVVLEQELLAWRPDIPTRKLRQDTVMTMWFGWLYWQKRRKGWLQWATQPNAGRRTGLPWRPGGIAAVRGLSVGPSQINGRPQPQARPLTGRPM